MHQTLGALAHRRTDDCLTTPQARLKMDLINHLFDPDESRTKFDPNLLTTFGHILETSPRCNGILERGYTHGVRDSHHDYELQKHCAVAASATRPDDLVRTHMGWIKSIEERRLVAPSLVDRFEETLTRIAAWMKDAPELSSDLSRAAFLHDIGKIERQRVAFNMRLNECEVRAHGDDANQHSGRGHERAAVRVLGNAWRGKAPVTVDTFTTDSPIIGSTQQTMRPAVLEGLVKDIQRTFPTSSAGAPPSAPTDSISSRVMHERHRGILSVIAVHQFPLDALRKMQEGTEALIREIAPHELPADRTERRAVLRQNGITWARTLLELLFREQESLQNRDITSEILIPSAVSTRSTSPRLVHGSNELLTRARTSLSFYAKKLAELERIAAERMELAREGLLPDDACILPRGVETPFIDCAFVMWLADFFGKKDDIALRADASDYLTMCMEIYEAARFLATQRDSA